jgi:hypothetical protein
MPTPEPRNMDIPELYVEKRALLNRVREERERGNKAAVIAMSMGWSVIVKRLTELTRAEIASDEAFWRETEAELDTVSKP